MHDLFKQKSHLFQGKPGMGTWHFNTVLAKTVAHQFLFSLVGKSYCGSKGSLYINRDHSHYMNMVNVSTEC